MIYHGYVVYAPAHIAVAVIRGHPETELDVLSYDPESEVRLGEDISS